jgi:methionyl-tRNA formyltransferase
MQAKLKIIFYGTPGFAVPCLEILIRNHFDIVAVVTVPDKPAGRGLQVRESEVKFFATDKKIRLLQPVSLLEEDFQQQIHALQPDLQVVVAFRKLPPQVFNLPKLGTINVHASLLPDYRGAAPINWAIINGETLTGVTTFFINDKIDTGDILLKKEIPIGEKDTAGTLHDKLSRAGADLLLQTVNRIMSGNRETISQTGIVSEKKAPKLSNNLCEIQPDFSVRQAHNFIRGLSPHPCAWTRVNDRVLKVYASDYEVITHNYPLGSFVSDYKTYLKVALHDGFLWLKELQWEGRKRMNINEFVNGLQQGQQWIMQMDV